MYSKKITCSSKDKFKHISLCKRKNISSYKRKYNQKVEKYKRKTHLGDPKYILTYDDFSFEDISELQNVDEIFDTRKSLNYLKNLVTEQKDDNNPILIADLSKLVIQHLKWIKNLPTVMPWYAVKCNNNFEIVRSLRDFGCGFDCASKSEIKQILDLGVSSSKIIFANPIKPPSHLKYAYEVGVDLMTFDNADELEKIKEYHKNAKLILRIRVDDSKSVCQFGAKFGVHSGKTVELIKKIADLKMNLIGVSFHVGSGCGDPNAYYNAIKKAREVFDEAKEFGYILNFLDIGGGFPGDDNVDIKFEHHAKVINNSLSVFFSDLKVNVIAEPGRFYATSVMTIATNVTGRRLINEDKIDDCRNEDDKNFDENNLNQNKLNGKSYIDKSKSFMYYISDGTYGCFNCVLYDHWELKEISQMKFFVWENQLEEYFIKDKDNLKHKKKYISTIWGPTCDSIDYIVKNFPMPEIRIGDWIVFENFGAYTISAGCEFNGFPRPEVFYLSRRISKNIEKAFYDFYKFKK